jgi:hypothetical protein
VKPVIGTLVSNWLRLGKVIADRTNMSSAVFNVLFGPFAHSVKLESFCKIHVCGFSNSKSNINVL